MSKITILQLIRVAATVTGASSLIYLTAGYESALNHEITAFSLPLLFWRVMLYSAAGIFWCYRLRPRLRLACPARRIRRTECLMICLVISGELSGLLRRL
ncbi:hypothetical protein ISO66_05265 [Morganella morganii subsp. morganii]|uniref:hypothetical protein n=1 Tax=Morganella morganii TaxID=582 RepID=UPI001BD9869C|nr:hypothetical protein [Morganella morganii]MBT0332756.1 hypothetical protein [Morganella morganii subsp. morganii]